MRQRTVLARLTELLLLVGLVAVPSPGLAQRRVPDLSQVSIEDLMRIEITSASRKEQPAADVTAAVFVITHDDIRRSGMTSIPDLLRLVPGVEVAQINSNKWAVSVRGFNGLYANKLLVLVDGRSVYNRRLLANRSRTIPPMRRAAPRCCRRRPAHEVRPLSACNGTRP